jgi:hypothetical protein
MIGKGAALTGGCFLEPQSAQSAQQKALSSANYHNGYSSAHPNVAFIPPLSSFQPNFTEPQTYKAPIRRASKGSER